MSAERVHSQHVRGLERLKVLRTLLRLGTFTRKELAEEAGVPLDFVNGFVAQNRDLVHPVKKLRLGNLGPPEEMLVVPPEVLEDLREQLKPLYSEVEESLGRTQESVDAYTPSAIEYKLALDSLSHLEKRGERNAAEFRRVLILLTAASEKEGIPVFGNLEKDASHNVEALSPLQRIAKAHFDVCRGKLCCLSLPGFLAGEEPFRLAGTDALLLGLSYFRLAAETFVNFKAYDQLRSIDYWAGSFLGPILPSVLMHRDQEWSRTFEALLGAANAKQLPQVFATLLSRAKQFLEPKFQIIELLDLKGGVDPLEVEGVFVQLRALAQRVELPGTSAGPSSVDDAIRVVADPSRIMDGLVSIYCQNYSPQEQEVSALVNVRRDRLQVAILRGSSLELTRDVPLSETAVSPTGRTTTRWPWTTKKAQKAHKLRIVIKEVGLTAKLYSEAGGRTVDCIYVTGRYGGTNRVAQAMASHLNVRATMLDPFRKLGFSSTDPSNDQLRQSASRLAPEIGIAIRESRDITLRYGAPHLLP